MAGPPVIDPTNSYWFVGGDTTRVFSSSLGNYVTVSDPTYQAWLSAGHVTLQTPSEQALYNYLVSKGVDPGVLANTAVSQTVAMWALQAALAAYAGGDKQAVYDSWLTANKATKLNLYFQWRLPDKPVSRGSTLVTSIINNTGLTSGNMDAIFNGAANRALAAPLS